MRNLFKRSIFVVGAVAALVATVPARALVINLTFGGKFDDSSDPSVALYQNVARAAAAEWVTAASGWGRVADYQMAITLGTADMGNTGTYALTHADYEQAAPNPITHTRLWESSFITVNENYWTTYFFDPTPMANDEFTMNQYGGLFGTAKGAAQQSEEDALSLLVHELGHALGFMGATGSGFFGQDAYGWNAYTDFANNLDPTTGDFAFDTVYSGIYADVPMEDPFHINGDVAYYSRDLMAAYSNHSSGPQLGERRLISPTDAAMIADAFNLIPEPGSLALVFFALAGLASTRRTALLNRAPRVGREPDAGWQTLKPPCRV